MVSAGSAANLLLSGSDNASELGCTQGDALLARTAACLRQTLCLTGTQCFTWCLATDQISGSEQLFCLLGSDGTGALTLAQILSRIHPEDLAALNLQIDRARSEGCDIGLEFRYLTADQQPARHLRMAACLCGDSPDRLYVGALQDVTALRLCEDALREARAELAYVARVMSLGALSASIAHEIKQPLSGIITNASTCLRMLAAEPPDIIGARETAKRTLRDGNRASDVITRLRALFTRKTVSGQAVDVNQVAHEALNLALSDLSRRRITVLEDLAEDLPGVRGDRIQLHQVILNLILNAADAMGGIDDRPRRLKIRTQLDRPDGVQLSVQDTGTGIGAHAARLFEPFYTTKTDGMGIGLSISHTIIASHGGRLWATSNEGPGATFCFSIPCAKPGPRLAGARAVRDDPHTVSLEL